MKDFDPMKAVYSYYFPETRAVVNQLALPSHEIFLTQTDGQAANDSIKPLGLRGFEMPQTPLGKVDLDAVHEPIIDAIIEEYKEAVPGLSDFAFRYPTSGSSEGIFHYLSFLRSQGISNIYTLPGEYEGYKEYGKGLGIETHETPEEESTYRNRGFWFISNPSARNGNIINNDLVNGICEAGNDVALDLAYAGNTNHYQFDVSNPRIKAVFMSFSKPYGLFRFRIGFAFSREAIPTLYANKWFKSIPALLLALKVAQDIGPRMLPAKYKSVQREIVDEINLQTGLNITPSDALLLGNIARSDTQGLTDEQKRLIGQFLRADNYRFCLTPYFERIEKAKAGVKDSSFSSTT